jgi:lipopolysaccharide transport system permease protein
MKALTLPFKILHDRSELIHELVRRELRDRHAGQLLGVLWAYGHPLLLMLIYTFLFAYVFPTRFASNGETLDFSVNVLAGIVSWLTFQDLLIRAPSILHGHSNLVKQIVFPTEVLPIKTAFASVLPYSVGIVFAVIYAYLKGTLSLLSLTLPLLIFCQAIAMVGVAFLLSACGVFLRDIRDIVSVFCTVNLFAQPILYNPYATPDLMKYIFVINPFSYMVWCWQDALYYGNIAHPSAWIIFPLECLFILVLGWIAFERTKHLFGDAL